MSNPDGASTSWRMADPKWRRRVGVLVALTVFAWLAATLYRDGVDLLARGFSLNPWLLSASLLLVVCHFVLTGIGWWILLRFFETSLPLYQAVRIALISLLGRYVPGKMWTVLGKVYLAARQGVPVPRGFAASAYEFFFFNIGGLLTFGALEAIRPSSLTGARAAEALLAAALLLLVAWPNGIAAVLNALLRRLGKETLDVALSRGQALVALLYFASVWVVGSYSFFLFLRGMSLSVGFTDLAKALILSNIAGFLVLVAPGGLGVREGTMSFLLTAGAGLPAGEAVLISLLGRVWSTLGELLVVMPVYLIRGKILPPRVD